MKLFKKQGNRRNILSPVGNVGVLVSFDEKVIYNNGDSTLYEEVDTKLKRQDFCRLHIVEETFSVDCDKDWHLKDILYVPVDGKEVAFRVEHITDDRVYFVAVDAIGASNIKDMNDFLDDYLKKMPEGLVNNMCEMEHCVDGNIVRKSKLTLLSRKNVSESKWDYECNGADDITFDGLKTEAERCKNFDGETEWYWLDTPLRSPNVTNSTPFWYVHYTGGVFGSLAYGLYAVVPCFSICNK